MLDMSDHKADLFILQQLLEHNPQAVAIFDRELRYLAVNPRWRAQHKLDRADIIGKTHAEVLPSANGDWNDLLTRGLDGEVQQRDDLTVQPWRTAEGQVGGVMVYSAGHDKATPNGAASGAFYKSILDAADDFIIVADLSRHIVYVNKLHPGFRYEEVIGREIYDFVPPEHVGLAKDACLQILEGAEAVTYETLAPGPGGVQAWFGTRVTPLFEGKRITHFVFTATDITERVTTRNALQQQETQQRLILDALPSLIWYKDTQNNILRVNQAVADSVGVTPEEMTGKHSSVFYPDMADQDFQDDLAVIRSGKPRVGIVDQVPVAHNEKRWIQTDKIPTHNEDGEVDGLIVIATDITERMDAEQKISESRRLAQEIAASVPSLVYIYDFVKQRNVYANMSVGEYLGYSSDEIHIMGSSHIVHPDDMPRLKDHLTAVLSADDNQVTELEYRAKAKDGSWHWLVSRDKVFKRDSDGNVLQLIGAADDITELRNALSEYDRIFNNSYDMIGTGGFDGYFKRLNPAFVRTLGFTVEELTSRPFHEFVHPDDVEATLQASERLSQGHGYVRFENRYRTKDGDYRWLAWTSTPDPENDEVNFIAQDITQRKAAEAASQVAQRQLQTVLDNADLVLFATDQDGIFTLSEGRGLAALGLEPGQVVGVSALEIYRDFPDVYAGLVRALKGETFTIEAQAGDRYYRTHYAAVHADRGEFTGTIGISVDITERKQVEDALEQERNRLQTIMDVIPDPIFMKDQTNRYISVNRAFLEYAGKATLEEIVAHTTDSFVTDPDYLKTVDDEFARVMQGEDIYNRLEGSTLNDQWFSTTKVGYRSGEGEIVGMVGITRDITDLKKAEDAVRASEQMLSTVLDTIPVRVFWKDRDGVFMGGNRAFAEDAQVASADVLIGKRDTDLFGVEDSENYRADDLQIIETGQPKLNIEETQTRDDGVHWNRVNKVPLRNLDGEIIGVLGTYEDITDRRQAEDLLRTSETRFRQLAESIDEVFFLAAPSGQQMYYVNPAFETVYGYPVAEAYKNPNLWLEVVHPEDMAIGRAGFAKIAQGKDYAFQLRIIRYDGDVRWIETRLARVLDETGELQAVAGAVSDITDRKLAERAREELLNQIDEQYQLTRRLTALASEQELVETLSKPLAETGLVTTTLVYVVNNPEGNPETATLVATVNENPALPVGTTFDLQERSFNEVWFNSTREPTIISNVQTDTRLDDYSRQVSLSAGYQSFVLIPLNQAGRWIGLVIFFWATPRHFSDDELALYNVLPSVVTPVAENLRLIDRLSETLEERQKLLDRTEYLYELGMNLTKVRDERGLMNVITDRLSQEVDAFYGTALFYLDLDDNDRPTSMTLMYLWNQGDAPARLPVGTTYDIDEFPFAELWLANPTEAQIISDVTTDERVDDASRAVFNQFGFRTLVVIPIAQAGRWIGVITLDWRHAHEFSEFELGVVRALPSLVAPVAENLRLIERLSQSLADRQKLLDRTERLYALGRKLTRATTPDLLVQAADELFADSLNVTLLYIDPDASGSPETMTIVAAATPSETAPVGTQYRAAELPSVKVWLADEATPQMISNVNTSERLHEVGRQAALQAGGQALVIVPLNQAGRWAGIIVYTWAEPREFNDDEVAVLRTLPALFTPVADNLRLIDQLEQTIDDLKVANRIAKENSRLKSEFLATMSHELRTPMNAIEGFTGIMLNHMGGAEFNEKTERYLAKVNANSKRLLALINDFLDLSRIESGRLELAHQPIDLGKLVGEWEDQTRVLAEQKDLSFHVHIAPELPTTLYGDEESLTKIAVNLLSNAVKFTKDGEVTLNIRPGTLKDDKPAWLIEVTDTGIGVPPHAREFIFDEFRQVDQSSKRLYGGTGLGLAIVQRLTRLMKGTVTVSSELDEGSTFTVTLPLSTSAEPVE